jgi:hypothetical protein
MSAPVSARVARVEESPDTVATSVREDPVSETVALIAGDGDNCYGCLAPRARDPWGVAER